MADTKYQIPHHHDPPPARLASFLKTLAAPWMILRPQQAARTMVAGSRLAFWVSFGLATLCLALLIIGFSLWEESLPPAFSSDDVEIHAHSIIAVWHDWHSHGWIGPAELILFSTCLIMPLHIVAAAWLYLPTVHRSGSVWHSFWRTCRAVACGIGPLNVGILLVGIPAILIDQSQRHSYPSIDMFTRIFTVLASLVGACIILYWLNRATLAVAGPASNVELPPRCESCGYDLTHRPDSGRCTECGASIDSSLTPDLHRPGCRWQRQPSVGTWLLSSLEVILKPSWFYGRLKMRRDERESRRFAVWHYLAIACLAGIWFFVFLDNIEDYLRIFLLLIICFLAPLAGWSVHRLVAAMMVSWAMVRGMLPDVSWAAKVMAYETAYLWVFCLYNGLLISSFFMFQDWITQYVVTAMLGSSFGIPGEPLAVIMGNAALITIWMWRYNIAFRRIRWSNY